MLPTFMTKKAIHKKPAPPPSGHVEQVMLASSSEELRPYWHHVGVIEGTVGDDVLVRFGEMVVQVPPEWLVPADT